VGKIKKTEKKPQGKIPNRTALQEAGLVFSFKYLDVEETGDFSLQHRKNGYTRILLQRLKGISAITVGEFLSAGKGLRSHPIKWETTARPEGFAHLNEQLRDIDAWQFQLSQGQHGRVHGFLIGSVFFVVWLDPDHRLYPENRR
jgi:hypothetical protein